VSFRRFAVVVLATGLAACGVAAAAIGPATVSARTSSLGEILVGATGRTLYESSAETPGRLACTGSCLVTWPPLVVAAGIRPVAGRGAKASYLGTTKRPDGRLQVTYRGRALYLFSGDRKPGQLHGEGAAGGLWHAVAPSGEAVAAKAAAGTGMAGSQGAGTTPASGPSPGVNPGMWCAANPQSCVNGVPVSG
jgi:predicted lipoprotein with Yx(FWY)xxD motif